MSQVYASLWKATSGLSKFLIGSCYFLSAGLTTIAIALAILGTVLLRGRDLDGGNPDEKVFRPTYRMTEKLFLTRWYAPPVMGYMPADERDSSVNYTGGEKELSSGKKEDSVAKESCSEDDKY
jgi:hypothetical protein